MTESASALDVSWRQPNWGGGSGEGKATACTTSPRLWPAADFFLTCKTEGQTIQNFDKKTVTCENPTDPISLLTFSMILKLLEMLKKTISY